MKTIPSSTANSESLAERNRPRKQEYRLHIKNQKHQRKNIILGFELYPVFAYRFHTTFISALLDWIGLLRRNNPRSHKSREQG